MRVRVGDVRLFFDVDGAGLVGDGPVMRERPTLVLLSGGPGFDHTVFKPAYSRLAEVAQVVYLDFRGHGRSDRGDPLKWTVDTWASDLRAFCEVLGVNHPVVLGWSFGGMVAMKYATDYPEHPGKLILQSTRRRLDIEGLVRAFEDVGGAEAGRVAQAYWTTGGAETLAEYGAVCGPLYGPNHPDSDELARETYNVELLTNPGAVLRDVDLRPELAKVTCPTLVMAGDADPWGSIDAAAEIVAALPNHLVRYEKFSGAGHHLHHDDPDRLFRLLRDFLRASGDGDTPTVAHPSPVATAPSASSSTTPGGGSCG